MASHGTELHCLVQQRTPVEIWRALMCNAQKLPVLVAADTHPECMTGSDSTAYSADSYKHGQYPVAIRVKIKFPIPIQVYSAVLCNCSR